MYNLVWAIHHVYVKLCDLLWTVQFECRRSDSPNVRVSSFQDFSTELGSCSAAKSNACSALRQNMQAVFMWQAVLKILMELPNMPSTPSMNKLKNLYGEAAAFVSVKIDTLLGSVVEFARKHQVCFLPDAACFLLLAWRPLDLSRAICSRKATLMANALLSAMNIPDDVLGALAIYFRHWADHTEK